MIPLNDIKARLKGVGVSGWMLWGKNRDLLALAQTLGTDEQIAQAVLGTYKGKSGFLLATDRRIMFVSGGVIRHTVESFDYSKVSSVQYSTSFSNTKITIFASGNDAEIEKVSPLTLAQPMADYLQQRASSKSAAQPSTSTSVAASMADELAKLATLRDQGILTQTEFDQQKARLLAG